jgi:hypothetical protein
VIIKIRTMGWTINLVLLVLLTACGSGLTGQKGEVGGGNESVADAGLTWSRVGGIAGFCDIVTLSANGQATVKTCSTNPPQTTGEITLPPEMQRQLSNWIDRFETFTYEQSDPAVADAMTVTIVFVGRGTEQPDPDDYLVMERLATEVLRLAGEAP